MITGHDMRQLMQTGLLAFTDTQPVVRADLHPPLTSVSMTYSPAAHNGYGVRACRERNPEPLHLLNCMNVGCAMPVVYYPVIRHKHCASQFADRQTGRQLRAIRSFL